MRGLCRRSVGWMAAAMLAPGVALAALGADASTIEHDATQLKAMRSVTGTAAFSVHELQLAGQTRVREYVTPGNQVFAVTWSGPSIPDMQQLLGAYFPRFSKAAQATATGRTRPTRAPFHLEDPDLVIRTGGHVRAFFGVAYLPGMVPQGVQMEQIR
jgi:Protein of unknown function (DUF2844)